MRARLVMVVLAFGCNADVGGLDARLGTTVQAVTGVNDAPVLDAAKAPQLDLMLAGGAPSGYVGTPVSTLVDFATPSGQVDNVTDADNTDGDGPALLGMAVIGADATKGTWWYSLDNGTNWSLLGVPTAAAARLLDVTSSRLYFQPASEVGGTLAGITFCAWDRSSGAAGGVADTTTNGGSTAFSTATDTASINVVAIALRSSSQAGATASPATLSITKPVGVASRDVLVASIAVAPIATVITPPAGWALLERIDGANNSLATYTKLGAPADPATYVWTLTGAATAAGGVEDFFNVDSAAPVDDWGGQQTPSSLDHTTTPETATGLHTEIVNWFSYASAGTWTPPAGTTEVVDVNSEGATGAAGVSIEGAIVPMAPGGLVSPRTATASNDADTGATQTVVLRLTTINNAPVLDAAKSPALASQVEDAPAPVGVVGTLVSSLVDFPGGGGLDNQFDIDTAASAGIAITTADTTNGSWWYSVNNGTAWSPLGAVSATTSRLLAADALTRIYFQPLANFNGTIAGGITFRAWDRTSGTNGNTTTTTSTGAFFAFSIVTDTASITVTNVNDAPTATNLSAPETYTQNMQLDLIDIVAGDIDNATVTATLTLSNPAAGSLSTATSGAVTSTYVPGTGVWTASGAVADVDALLAGVTYTPAAGFSASFTIATKVTDGGASVNGTKAMTGVATSNAPAATNLSAAESYTEDTPLDLIDIVTSDSDSTSVTAKLTLSNPAAGTLSTATSGAVVSTYVAGTGVWTASGAIANVNVLLAGVTFTPASNSSVSFTIATNVSDGTSAVTGTKTVTGNAANDAPAATNLSATETYTEDTPLDLIDIVASDIDSASVTATLTLSNPAAGTLSTATSGAVVSTYVTGTGVWTASGAIAGVNVLLAGVTFTPASNSSVSFTIATNVSDGTLAVTGAKTVTGTAVDDAPAATNLSAPETYTEDTPLDLIDIVASDIDSASVTATLTLSDPTKGSLTTGTSGAVTSVYVPATGIWTAAGPIADVNALLAGVMFVPAANSHGSLTIATSVADATMAATGTKSVAGTAVDDAPAATNLSAPETYAEDTPLDLIDIVASDIDSANVTATLTLSDPTAGALSVATSGAVVSTYVAGTGVWSASGAIADVNVLLAGVTFTPASNSSASFTLATSVSDGPSSVSGTKQLTGTPAVDGLPMAVDSATSVDAAPQPDSGDPDTTPPPDGTGCGCHSAGSGPAWPFPLALLVVVRRRRSRARGLPR